jgi:hypothetical protein
LEPTRTIFFYGTRLREHCDEDHELGYHLTKRVAEVLIRRLEATRCRLIECVTNGKLGAVPPPMEIQGAVAIPNAQSLPAEPDPAPASDAAIGLPGTSGNR